MQANLFKLPLGCFLEFQEAIQKWPNEDFKRLAYVFAVVSVLAYQSK